MERVEAILKRVGTSTSTTSTSETKGARPTGAGTGDPNCPHCRGVGYVRDDVPFGHENFGKLFVCSCRLEEVQAAQKDYQKRLSSLGGLENKTFANFQPEGHANNAHQKASLKLAYDAALKYAANPRGWLLLHGSYGCGKTHLAAAIANVQLAQGQPVMFVNAPDLLDHLRATFGPSSEISYDELFDRVKNIPLLVVDDLGAESPTQWAQEKFYQIFNHRYNSNLPTVITSNVELERIEPRLRSRLVDMDLARKIVIDAPDFRRAEAESGDELSSLEHHRHQTFESFEARKGEITAEQQRLLMKAYEEAQDYANDLQGWIVFTGGHGAGKTHLAAAIANHCYRAGRSVLFVTVADLLDHLRATFSPDSTVRYDKRFNEVKSAPLLVLDDMSVETATPWAREKLMQLIDHRYVTALPTVITTAADKEELDDWMHSRLLDPRLSTICPIIAPIYKGGKGATKKKRK